MGFAGGSCSFTRLRVLDPVADEIIAELADKLKHSAFQDIDHVPEIRAFGWVCYDDMLDNQWRTAPPQKGEFAVFSLRLDTRRLPPGVVKKHFTLALRREKQTLLENGQKFISRERKKEIREQVLLALRERFLPVPAEFNVVWNLRSNEVWFASIQTKMIDLFMELFLNTFGLRLEELTPYNLAAASLGPDDLERLENLEAADFAKVKG